MSLGHPQIGVSRRTAIRAGALGFMGLGMSDLARLRAEAPGARRKSVIYVFLSGGLAQHESFDLKPKINIVCGRTRNNEDVMTTIIDGTTFKLNRIG